MSRETVFVLCMLLGTTKLFASENVDSLKNILHTGLSHQEELETLGLILLEYRSTPDSIFKYAEKLSSQCLKDDEHYLAMANSYIGQALKNQGKYEESVGYLYEAMRLKQLVGENTGMLEGVLGSVYGRIGDMDKTRQYFHLALNKRDSAHLNFIMITNNNFGEAFYQNGFYDSAHYYFSKAVELASENEVDYAYRFFRGNVGMVNLKLGNVDSAEVQLTGAVELLGDTNAGLTFQSLLAELYKHIGKSNEAIKIVRSVIKKAEINGSQEQVRDGYKILSEIYEEVGDYKQSLLAYREFIEVENSIRDIETVRKIGEIQTEYEVGQKQAELDLVNAERDKERLVTIGISLLAVVLLILGLVILKYYRQKEKTNKELERLNQTKDKFFSIISHDLRGPVSSFFGISRMIKSLVNRQQTEQLLAIADDIDESVDRLSALLDNLLNWAMQQQGHFPNVPEKVDLNEVTEDLIRTLDTMAKGKQIDLKAQIEGPIHLWVDKNTTMTILRNLANNALKFTPDGGSVTISAAKQADLAVIKVIDSGVGIPQEKLKNLFQLQDKKSTYGTSGEKGLGLGLQLVYEFVEMNGGKIEVTSEEGVGTTFTVSLPLYDLEEEVITT